MIRIICVNNRSDDEDAAGPQVHDRLADSAICEGVELIDGRLPAPYCLELAEETERVVIVDTMTGFGRPGEVIVIEDAMDADDRPSAGVQVSQLRYLNSLRQRAEEFGLPEVLVVGIEPPFDDFDIEMAAELCLGLAGEPANGREFRIIEQKEGHA